VSSDWSRNEYPPRKVAGRCALFSEISQNDFSNLSQKKPADKCDLRYSPFMQHSSSQTGKMSVAEDSVDKVIIGKLVELLANYILKK
jgi:hypothetical protein